MDPTTDSHTAAPVRTDTLYAVIGSIAQGPDLDRVLPAVVDLLVDATACHACFIYLREGDRLRIRAASPIFHHVIDNVTLGMDEGLTGWVARNRLPAFIPEAAMDDPRMKYIPELDEERFQSMVAVPLVHRHGDVIGVVVLHTQAPREFGQDVLDLLVHVASLVVGAIDNARLFEQTQHQVAALSALNALSEELASLTHRDELYAAGCQGIARLLDADNCQLSLFDSNGAAVDIASHPPNASPNDATLVHAPARGRLTAHLLDGARAFGQARISRARPFTDDDAKLLETATHQLALALRTAALIERLAAENRIRQVFEALENGNADQAAAHARAAGWDTDRPYLAIVAVPTAPAAAHWEGELGTEVQRRLRLTAPHALADRDRTSLRALMALPSPAGPATEPARLKRLHDALETMATELGVSVGISRPRHTLSEALPILREAADAARITAALHPAGGARPHASLGPYRFLVNLIGSTAPDPAHVQALETLADYDARRGATLLATLEAYLAARGAIRATAETLIIHPNTLRQRLKRIEVLAGLTLADEDLLSLELSLKLHHLHQQRTSP